MHGCYSPIRRTDYGPECTRELVAEVAKQLATRSVRDTDFILADAIDENDNVAIVQGGVNKRISLDTLSKALKNWLDIDSIKDKLDSIDVEYHSTAYWDSMVGFIPQAGAIIIYSDYRILETPAGNITIPGIKIGSGNGYVQDLPFIGGDEAMDLIVAHINNLAIHVTAEDREFWNRKLNVTDGLNKEVVDETLILHRN